MESSEQSLDRNTRCNEIMHRKTHSQKKLGHP